MRLTRGTRGMAIAFYGRMAMRYAQMLWVQVTSSRPDRSTGGGAPAGTLAGPFSDVGRDRPVPGRTIEPAGLPAALVLVLVADAGLGTINSIRPAVAALGAVAAVTTLLNRYDAEVELHRRNLDWLRSNDGLAVVTSVEQLASAVGDVLAEQS